MKISYLKPIIFGIIFYWMVPLYCNTKDVFFVLGAGRSGTSYLTNSLNMLGCELPKKQMSPNISNIRGYFEPLSLVALNDQILSKNGLAWNSLVITNNYFKEKESLSQWTNEINNIVNRNYLSDKIVIKDPRLSLVAFIYKKWADEHRHNAYFVIPIRNPADAIRSISTQATISNEESYKIWLNLVLNAELHTRNTQRSFVLFPDWTQQIEKTIEKIEKDIGYLFGDLDIDTIEKIRNEFDPSLVHFRENKSVSSSTDQLAQLSLEIFGVLQQFSSGNANDPILMSKMDHLRDVFSEMLNLN